MGAGDGAVDHLDAVGRAFSLVQGLQDRVPDPRQCPSSELPIDGRPGTEVVRQVSAGRTGAGDPEHAVQNPAVILRWTAPLRSGLDHEGGEERPFLVAHKVARHSFLPSWEGL